MSKLDFAFWDAVPEGPAEGQTMADIYDNHIRLAAQLEELGWHSYFTIEHQNRPGANITSPSVYLDGDRAATTSRIRIGTMMWQLPFYNPLRLAQEVAMLDQLSRGRVEFGSGIGVHEHEFIRWGIDFYQRAAISEEVLQIIKMAWTQHEVTFEGKYFNFDEALPNPRPFQKPYPPIWAAVHSDEAMRFAARNNYHVAQNLDTDEAVARKFDIYRETWKECGHEGPMPRVFLQRTRPRGRDGRAGARGGEQVHRRGDDAARRRRAAGADARRLGQQRPRHGHRQRPPGRHRARR